MKHKEFKKLLKKRTAVVEEFNRTLAKLGKIDKKVRKVDPDHALTFNLQFGALLNWLPETGTMEFENSPSQIQLSKPEVQRINENVTDVHAEQPLREQIINLLTSSSHGLKSSEVLSALGPFNQDRDSDSLYSSIRSTLASLSKSGVISRSGEPRQYVYAR